MSSCFLDFVITEKVENFGYSFSKKCRLQTMIEWQFWKKNFFTDGRVYGMRTMRQLIIFRCGLIVILGVLISLQPDPVSKMPTIWRPKNTKRQQRNISVYIIFLSILWYRTNFGSFGKDFFSHLLRTTNITAFLHFCLWVTKTLRYRL